MLPDIQPGNTKILYFFNCLLDGMHTRVPKCRALNSDKWKVTRHKKIEKIAGMEDK